MKRARAEAAIAHVVDVLGRAFRGGDLDAVLSVFGADAACVGITGNLIVGRDALAAAASDYLASVSDESTLAFDIVHIAFVRDDVAVVMVRHDPITSDGEVLEGEPVGESMFVIAHERTGWLIVAWQLTVIG